jgi:hypothetical protein
MVITLLYTRSQLKKLAKSNTWNSTEVVTKCSIHA